LWNYKPEESVDGGAAVRYLGKSKAILFTMWIRVVGIRVLRRLVHG